MITATWWPMLDSVGFHVMRTVLSIFWQSSILLAAAALLGFALRRRRASVRHALWVGALLISPLLPLLASAASKIGTPQTPIRLIPTYSAASAKINGLPRDPRFADRSVKLQGRPSAVRARAAVPRQMKRFSLTDYPWGLTLMGYACGFALCCSLVALGARRVRGWLRQSHGVTDPRMIEAFERARFQLRLKRRFHLVETDVRVPMTVGTIHPIVLLPTTLARDLSDADLKSVALHELTHIKRFDAPLLMVVSLLRAAFFFHPLVWWSARQIATLAEQAADDAVLDITGEPISYAKMLTRLAENLPRRMLATELAVGIVFSRSAFVDRVQAILSDRKRYVRRASAQVLAATIVAALTSVALAAALPLGDLVPKVAVPPSDRSKHEAPQVAASGPVQRRPSESRRATQQAPPFPNARTSKSNDPSTSKRTMLIHVVGPDGEPMPGAKVYAGVHPSEEPFKPSRDYVCDASGTVVVELPQTFDDLRIWAGSDGYVPMFASWIQKWQADGHLVPEEFTFQLPQGTLIGGFIKNEDGQPIAGARVEVRHFRGGRVEEEMKQRPILSTWLATSYNNSTHSGARTTDAQGRWSLDNVPAGDEIDLRVHLSHPDHVDDRTWGGLQREQGVTTESLRTGAATIVMRRGISVTGTVTDANSKPVPGAVVVWGRSRPLKSRGSKKIRTDQRGVYRFPPLPPGPMTVTVMAQGWAPDLREVEISPQNPPVDFQLKRGGTIRLRIVEEESGAPVPQVQVNIIRWRDSRSLYNRKHPYVLDNKIPFYADEEGLFEWTWAPEDRVTYSFYKKGYQTLRDQTFTADDLEHEIRLSR